MKKRTVIGFLVSLTVLGTGSFPVFAQSTRQLRSLVSVNLNEVQNIRSEAARDTKLEKAILQNFPTYREFASTPEQYGRYYYNRVDLNSDNKPEVLVRLVGQGVCGSGGCPTFILQTVGQDYRLVSEIALTGGSVIVTNQRTLGWNDLIVSPGRLIDSGYRLMQFNGRGYPASPEEGVVVRQNSRITGRAFLSDTTSSGGIALQPIESQTTTAQSSNTRRSMPVAEVFRSILPQLKQQTGVLILLPSELFGRQPGERIYVSGIGETNGYKIKLESVPNCRGANTCFIGYFGAERTASTPSSDQGVRLARGITGYYTPLSCGGSCSPPSICWMHEGVLYSIQMRVSRDASEAKATMIRLANSAIEAGLQDY